MTKTYKIAEEIANEIVKVKNAKYEALKERDFESYGKFDELEDNLFDCIKNFGYDDIFVKQGGVSELEKINGLDVQSIVETWIKANEHIANGVING